MWYNEYVEMFETHYKYITHTDTEVGGIRGTVVAHWTAGQQVEGSIVRQVHDS